jgi:hypothetical protein
MVRHHCTLTELIYTKLSNKLLEAGYLKWKSLQPTLPAG